MLKNDPYSEFKANRIVQMHNSFDKLLEALKAYERFFSDGTTRAEEQLLRQAQSAIAEAEDAE